MRSVLVIVFLLLPFCTAESNQNFVIRTVKKLCNFYNIQTIVIFTEEFVEGKNDFDLPREVQASNQLPQMHFNEFSYQQLKFSVNTVTTLVIIQGHFVLGDFRNTVDARLRGMHYSKVLIVLRQPVLFIYLNMLRKWLWRKKFHNVVIIFEDLQTHQQRIYAIDPYPSAKWSNKTMENNTAKLFPEKTRDFKKYRIRTPFMEDIPGVFIFQNQDNYHLVGNEASYIKEFARYMNIWLEPIFIPNMDMEKIFRLIRVKNVELSVHTFPVHHLTDIGRSYPVEIERWCIMVPFRNLLPKSEVVFKPFDRPTWLVIGLVVIYVAWLLSFVDPPAAGDPPGLCLLRSLAMLLYSSNMVRPMALLSTLQCIFYGLVSTLGFILFSFYTSFLSRFCTTLVFRTTIDSIDDLISENLRIMIIDYETSAVRLQSDYDEKFFKLLYPMPYYDVITHRNDFNRSFAYSIAQSQWNHLNKEQSQLKRPLFRLSEICYGQHFRMFPLQYDSHLKPYLDDFILRIKEAGLDLVWKDRSFRMSVTNEYSRMLVDKLSVIEPLDLEFFKFVFILMLTGMILSVISFLIEVLWKKILILRLLQKKLKEIIFEINF